MSFRRTICAAALLVLLHCYPTAAGDTIPFHGTWKGTTVSAVPVSPTVVFVVASGGGQATHLGKFEMTSPHFSTLDTLFVEGEQNFTAANGDTLAAHITGFLAPVGPGVLEGTLEGTITGGTGRFAGATGRYNFHLVSSFNGFGFDTVATIDGVISSTGANKR
jgi:hypothetical protein